MVFGRSKSSLRAEAAEAEVVRLREKLQTIKVAGAFATESTRDAEESKLKSASSIRADVAEAELTKLRMQMQKKRKFLKFTCEIGWCSHGCECCSAFDEELGLLKRRLAAMERELQQMEHFSVIRNEMECRIKKVAKEIQRKYAKASALDLVIVMDCTSSMDPWIAKAKAAIVSIIGNIKKDHPSAHIRVGFVAYRDFCDHSKRIQTMALTSDVTAVQQFITSLEAFGGGDGPEDIPGGLEAALAMSFHAEAKRIVVVGDSPCHGSKFHDEEDNMAYRAQIEQSPDICSQMREMAERGIDFSFIEIEPHRTAKMVAILQEEFLGAESYDGFDRDFQKLPLWKAGDIAHFASVITSSSSSSIFSSKQRNVFVSSKDAVGGYNFMRYKNKPRIPVTAAFVAPPEVKPLDWSKLSTSPAIAAVRHSLHFRPGEPVDWKDLDLKHTQQDTTIRLSRSCFAKGAMRSAHALLDCNMEAHLVAKCYFGKAASVSSTSKTSLENDVKMQIVAKRLASEFSMSDNIDKGVDFIFTCWYEVKNPREAGLSSSMTMFTAEPYIEGEYKKYNNNNGWIRDDGLDFSETAQAFSHFTWQRTFGELMVVDLQGVGGIFTDPQIHSKSGKFGCGNLLEVGMTAFFATHKCNSSCSALGLKPLQSCKTKTKIKTTKAVAGVEKAPNKLMTCSCPLCGVITMVLRNDFAAAYREGREIYCELCTSKCTRKIRTKCQTCKQKFEYSPYWHSMKGMEPAVTCVACEAKH